MSNLFSGKNKKKKILSLSSAELAQRVVKVKKEQLIYRVKIKPKIGLYYLKYGDKSKQLVKSQVNSCC